MNINLFLLSTQCYIIKKRTSGSENKTIKLLISFVIVFIFYKRSVVVFLIYKMSIRRKVWKTLYYIDNCCVREVASTD